MCSLGYPKGPLIGSGFRRPAGVVSDAAGRRSNASFTQRTRQVDRAALLGLETRRSASKMPYALRMDGGVVAPDRSDPPCFNLPVARLLRDRWPAMSNHLP